MGAVLKFFPTDYADEHRSQYNQNIPQMELIMVVFFHPRITRIFTNRTEHGKYSFVKIRVIGG